MEPYDYATGLCTCATGFTGWRARMLCPSDCSLPGQCMSLATAAIMFDGYRLNHSTQYTTAQWDAHMIHGCVCDLGFTGHDCSQRECPRGDDVRTIGQRNEVATLYCVCPPPCDDSFNFSSKARRTRDVLRTMRAMPLADSPHGAGEHSFQPSHLATCLPSQWLWTAATGRATRTAFAPRYTSILTRATYHHLVVTSKLSTGGVANASARSWRRCRCSAARAMANVAGLSL